jgi:acyl-CoA synthetase (NDP forming)
VSAAAPHPRAAHPLDAVFRARSVALVGVSADAHKLNGAPLPILKASGFRGAIYPVNPKYDAIDGLCCFARVEDLPEAPDVALVLAPAREVPGAIGALARRGTRAAVVVSSGFEEQAGGDALVERLAATCREYGVALVGPNCEGVWSVRSRVMLTFGSAAKRSEWTHAPLAIVSQSGAMAGAIGRHLQDGGFGCAYLVSVGNETVLGLVDHLEYLVEQDDVRVVLMFMEGLRDGDRLLRVAARARSRGIVLVALKSGDSPLGRAAVASHTGKVATDAAIYRDVLAQAGVVQVDGLSELIEAAELFLSAPLPRASAGPAPGVSVYSIPGGTRALTADQCERRGVPMATFEAATERALAERLPAFGQARNPTDITGQLLSRPEMFDETLRLVAADANTEALVVQLANRGPADALRYRDTIRDAARMHGVPAVVSFLGDALPARERRAFADHGIACARDPNEAVRWLSWLYGARAALGRGARVPAWPAPQAAGAVRAVDDAAAAAGAGWAEGAALLERAGVPAVAWALLPAGTAAARACAELRFPVALKALPEQAAHKTELGLLRLGLRDADAVDAAAGELRVRLGVPDATLLVQQMAEPGVEMVLTAMRNPDFGLVVALGSGGTQVELLDDVGFVAAPFDEADVERVLARLRVSRLLDGFRGAPPADRDALARAAVGLARAFAATPLREVEINPLIVGRAGRGVVAVDVLQQG